MGEILYSIQNRDQYQKLLSRPRPKTVYIQLVQVDRKEDNPAIPVALNTMKLLDKKKTTQWPGTVMKGSGALQYTFQATEAFWKQLLAFQAFFFNSVDEMGCDVTQPTDFGLTDIACYDAHRNLLFYTVTHEGIAVIVK